jgi:hypothetical protein
VFEISSKADWWTMLCLNLAMVLVPLLGLCSMFSALVFIQSLNSGTSPPSARLLSFAAIKLHSLILSLFRSFVPLLELPL